MARPVAPAATISPAVYALSLTSFIAWVVVFVFVILSLSLPYYSLPLSETLDGSTIGTLTTCFGLTAATCCASSGSLSDQCASTPTTYADAAKIVCSSDACQTLAQSYTAGVSLGSAAVAVYVISLATSLLAMTAAAILVARARGWLAPGGLSAILSNNLLRTGAGVMSFILIGSGAGLGANAASVVSTAVFNYSSGAGYGMGVAGAGLGLGAFACLLAFIAMILDAIVSCGCCCARGSPGGVVDFSGAGAVVIANAAGVATRLAGARPSAK